MERTTASVTLYGAKRTPEGIARVKAREQAKQVARTRLVELHREEYARLYHQEVERRLGRSA